MTITEYTYNTKITIKHSEAEFSYVKAFIWAPTAMEAVRRLAKRFSVDAEKLEDVSAETDRRSMRELTATGELAA